MLVITMYEHDGEDRFTVMWVEDLDGEDKGEDVTDLYEVMASQLEDGRSAFTVVRKVGV